MSDFMWGWGWGGVGPSNDILRPTTTSNDLQIENVITMALCILNES